MTRTFLAIVIAVGLLAVLPLQTAAADTVYLFLKLNGSPVAGESTQGSMGRKDSIECTSYSQKVTTDVVQESTGANASQIHAGRVQIQPITITKRIDKASPLLMKAALTNQVAEGELRFYRPNPAGDGTTEQFYTVRFSHGFISSVRQYVPDTPEPAKAAEPPQEEVTFASANVEYIYVNGGISTTTNATGATLATQSTGGTATVGTGATSPTAGDTLAAATAATNECVLGTAYRLGTDKDGITLIAKSAEYTPGHVAVGSGSAWAAKDEKLMVVHCTLANSNATTTHVRWNTIEWNATTVNNVTRQQDDVIVEEAALRLDQDLLPKQSVDCYAIFRLPAAGAVKKLVAHLHGTDPSNPDARYDITGKVIALPAPYLNIKDTTGATILSETLGQIGGGPYVLGGLGVKVVTAENVDTVLSTKAKAGKIFELVTLEYTNFNSGTVGLRPQTDLHDEDNTVYGDEFGTISAVAMRKVDVQVKPGETVRIRLAYLVPADVPLKSLTLNSGNERPVMVTMNIPG